MTTMMTTTASVPVNTTTTPAPVITPPVAFPTFNGTCMSITYPCKPGTRYTDPCDCKFYYVCRDLLTIVRNSCSRGAAYDHRRNNCDRFSNVVSNGKCDQTTPWNRCQDIHSQADLGRLQTWCTGSGYFTQAPPRRGDDDDASGGAIAAIVILLVLLVVIVVLVVIYVRRKGNPIQHIKQSRFWRETIRREGRQYDDRRDEEDNYSQYSDDNDPSAHHHHFEENDDETARRRRKSQEARNYAHEEEDHQEPEHHDYDDEEAGACGGYDNPALDCDTPPPDTEASPAPPGYSSFRKPRSARAQDDHYRARELNEMDHDTDDIEPTLEEEGYAMEERDAGQMGQYSQRSTTPPGPYLELGEDGEEDENTLENSFTA